MSPQALAAFNREISEYRNASSVFNSEASFHHLARAHILSQKSVVLHLKTHVFMLQFALTKLDTAEVFGQLLRLIVTIPGHLFGKVPKGNIGWATVGLTQEMSIPPDLEKILE